MGSNPLVAIIMGSRSDWETMQHAAKTLDQLGIPYEQRVVSAHRTPDLLFEYAASAAARGLTWRTSAGSSPPIERPTRWRVSPARRRGAGLKLSSLAPAARRICRA